MRFSACAAPGAKTKASGTSAIRAAMSWRIGSMTPPTTGNARICVATLNENAACEQERARLRQPQDAKSKTRSSVLYFLGLRRGKIYRLRLAYFEGILMRSRRNPGGN